jgi:signal transduction histidine kinase
MLGAEIHLDEVEDIIAANKAALKDKVTKNTIKVIFVIFFLTISAILFEMCISKKIKNIIRNQEIQYF